MAAVRTGGVNGAALPIVAVRNILQFFSTQWRITAVVCCNAGALVQVGLLLFSQACPTL